MAHEIKVLIKCECGSMVEVSSTINSSRIVACWNCNRDVMLEVRGPDTFFVSIHKERFKHRSHWDADDIIPRNRFRRVE